MSAIKKGIRLVVVLLIMLTLAACSEHNNSDTAGKNTTSTVINAEITDGTLRATEDSASEYTAIDTTTPILTPATTDPTIESGANTTPVTQQSHTHSYATTVTASTCTNGGYTTYKCACGDSYISDKVSAVGHSFGQWETTKAATATATGSAQRVCGKCNTKETKTLGKLFANHSHDYTRKVIQAATCTREGVQIYTCACGDSFTESLPIESHDLKLTAGKEPDCKNAGYDIATCIVCGYSVNILGSPADPTAHIYAKTEQPATCTENGSKKYTCTVCGTSYSETIQALGHNYKVVSCEANRVCNRCGGTGDYYEHDWCVDVEEGKPLSKQPRYCRDCRIIWCDYYGHIWDTNGQCIWTFCDSCKPE